MYGNDPGQGGGGVRLGGREHEQHKSRCGLFLLSLIGQDPLSLTFCTPSPVFHMLILDRPEEETCWSWVEEDKDSLSLSLPPFRVISPPLFFFFFASSPLKQLDRLWHERKWVLSGWERWGWHSGCDPHHLWGSSALHWSLVMCMWSFILSGPCGVYCRSVIVWGAPPVVL